MKKLTKNQTKYFELIEELDVAKRMWEETKTLELRKAIESLKKEIEKLENKI